MKPAPENYAIWPSVVPAGRQTEMTIRANENAFLFWEGRAYTVIVIPVDSDVRDYHAPGNRTALKAIGHNGVLQFHFLFSSEQEFQLDLYDGERLLQTFSVYALESDLYTLRPLKGDLHCHSFRSDGRRDPAALAGHYREQGYDFMALTDHNRFAPGAEILDAYRAVSLGITVLRGEEVHAPGSVVHIVHVGGAEGVADTYVHDQPRYLRELEECGKALPDTLPPQYRERYIKAEWACRAIHRAGGLAIFPHPYWQPAESRSYNVCNELIPFFFQSGFFDAYELVGGMGQRGINLSVALWNDLRAEGVRIPVVGSSDVHALRKYGGDEPFPNLFTIAFAGQNESASILEAVRRGLTVAVEATGEGGRREYRCYGSRRLVAFAQYLLACYFPRTHRIMEGEGVIMRQYLIGEADHALLNAMTGRADAFYRRFFGREAPVLPGIEQLAFEEKWRAVQMEGPVTKGGSIALYGDHKNKRQI